MGYPDILPGNDGVRSADGSEPPLQEVLAVDRRGGRERALVIALALVVVVVTLVAKPWDQGPLTAAHPRDVTAAPPAASGSVVASPVTSAASPDLASGPIGSLEPVAAAGATASPPPGAYIENLDPIEPDRWAHLSASLRAANADGVVFIARYPQGLYYSFLPVAPSADATLQPPRTDGTSDTVRATGYLAHPVAIGLTRPTDADAPSTLAWQVLGPGRLVRVTLRHPLGDLDRYLFLGPGLGLPPGERRNRREISRWPPTWQAGVYRFDLATDAGTRYLFVILEP